MVNELLGITYEGLAVLLIDMQDHFINTEEKKNLVPNHISVIRFCAEKNIPVVVLEFSNRGQTTKALREEVNKLPKENVCWLKKYYNDAFCCTKLHKELQSKGIRTLLLMGINAGYCIYSTGRSAIKHGYKIVTSGDLIAGYIGNKEIHCSNPEWYMRNGVYVDKHTSIIK